MAFKIEQIKKQDASKKKNQSKISDFLNKDINLFSSGLSNSRKQRFFHSAYILLQAGLGFKSTIELAGKEFKNKKDKEFFNRLLELVVSGSTLAEAMQQSKAFNAYDYLSIKIGEEAGNLIAVLQALSIYYKKRIEQRKKVSSAMAYPVLVIATAVGAIWFMLHFIVPLFADAFNRFGGELPALTQWIIKLSAFVDVYGLWLLFVGVVLMISLIFARKTTTFRKHFDLLLTKLPLIGKLLIKVQLSQFYRSMALMLQADVALSRGVQLCADMIAFWPLKENLGKTYQQLLEGKMLHECLSQATLYESKQILLIKVGEQSNRLTQIFAELADQLDADVDQQTTILTSLLEPLLIIVLAVFVAIILIAMYLPIFSLSNQMGF